MENRKNVFVIGSLILTLGLSSGCNNSPNSNFTSSSSSSESTNSTSLITEQRKKQKKPDTETMNFAQIQQGDYSSLLGEWEEVAIFVNKQDGKGSVWVEPRKDKLTISKNKIENDSAILMSEGLSNDNVINPVDFSEKDGYLSASSYFGAQLWNASFYPKGTVLMDFGVDIPIPIDDTKERISIGTNHFIQVFQRNSSVVMENQNLTIDSSNKSTMNIGEIIEGNYSSINGTWKNDLGQTVVVENNTMNFTDITVFGESGEVTELNLNIPDWNLSDGTPKLVPYLDDSNKVAAYNQRLIPYDYERVYSLRSGVPGAVLYISFLPKGIMGDIQGGDINQEKIVAVATQNNPTAVPETYVYYKSN